MSINCILSMSMVHFAVIMLNVSDLYIFLSITGLKATNYHILENKCNIYANEQYAN